MKTLTKLGILALFWIGIIGLAYAGDGWFTNDNSYIVKLEIQLPNAVKTTMLNHPKILDIQDRNGVSYVEIDCNEGCDGAVRKVEIIAEAIISECRVNYLNDGSVKFSRVSLNDGSFTIDNSNEAHQLCVYQLLG